ncbi:MAG: hypothetical protein P8076_08455 [Gammaproteobacteria bacterium]
MPDDEVLRRRLQNMLEGGLTTEVEPRAYEHEQVLEVTDRLRGLPADDYEGKLRVAGFTLDPYGSGDDAQACETCMYYVLHRKFCELPELMLPVEAQWSCRLWRI